MAKPHLYDTSFAEVHDTFFSWDERFKNESPFYKKLLKKRSVKNALDVGCGDGFHLFLFSKCSPKTRLFGADVSKRMIKKAKEKLKDKGIKAKLTISDLKEIDSKFDENFDLITCNFTLSAFYPGKKTRTKTFQKALKKLKGLLSKDGILVIQDLNGTRIKNNPEEVIKRPINDKRYALFKRERFSFFVNKDANKPVRVKRKGKRLEIDVRISPIYDLLNKKSLYLRTNEKNGELTVHNHILIRQGLLKRMEVENYRSINWFVTPEILEKGLKKAGFSNPTFFGDDYTKKGLKDSYSFTAVFG